MSIYLYLPLLLASTINFDTSNASSSSDTPETITHLLIHNRHPEDGEEDFNKQALYKLALGERCRIEPSEDGLYVSVEKSDDSDQENEDKFRKIPYYPKLVLSFGQDPDEMLETDVMFYPDESESNKIRLIRDELEYDGENNLRCEVSVYYSDGKLAMRGILNEYGRINLSALNNGVYVALVLDNGTIVSRTFYLKK